MRSSRSAIFGTIIRALLCGLCCGNSTVKDQISGLIPGLQKKNVRQNEPMNLTCAEYGTLPKLGHGEQYEWYVTESDEPLNVFLSADPDQNRVMLRFPDEEGEEFAYLYCVDPVTDNIVKAFQLFGGHLGPLYHNRKTTCHLHEEYWTVLSCRDTLKPPTEVSTCVWRYTRFGEKTENLTIETGDFIYLGEPRLFPAREGVYTCQCAVRRKRYKLMTFLVNQTSEVSAIGTYQFCLHVNKQRLLSEADNPGCKSQLPERRTGENKCPTKAYVVGLSVLAVLCAVLAILFLVLFLLVKKRQQHTSTHEQIVSM